MGQVSQSGKGRKKTEEQCRPCDCRDPLATNIEGHGEHI